MQTYAVSLRPQGSHVSPITAQTIFGGVCWALRALGLGGDLPALLAGFESQPRFLFSSAFPFIEGPAGDRVRFWPRPALLPLTQAQLHRQATAQGGPTTGKRYVTAMKEAMVQAGSVVGQAAYVSTGLFGQICRGEQDSAGLAQQLGDQVEQVGPLLWLAQERRQHWGRLDRPEPEQLWRGADIQRNAIDRVAGATAEGLLFHEFQTFYHRQRAGLWFLARADAEAWGWLQAAFRYLADTGLGGRRTVGKGHFDFSWEPAESLLPSVAQPDTFVTLSPYLPRTSGERLEATPLSYRLVPVRQMMERKFSGASRQPPAAAEAGAEPPAPPPTSQNVPLYSGELRLFAAGSVFALPESEPQPDSFGRLALLRQGPDHPIYYHGLALPVLARLGGAV